MKLNQKKENEPFDVAFSFSLPLLRSSLTQPAFHPSLLNLVELLSSSLFKLVQHTPARKAKLQLGQQIEHSVCCL